MVTPSYSASDVQPSQAVLDWLLDSDPAIRWQVLRDLTDASDEVVAVERARVGAEGWGAEVLALQGADSAWDGRAWNPGWDSTMHALWLLWLFGLDPAGEPAQKALKLVREKVERQRAAAVRWECLEGRGRRGLFRQDDGGPPQYGRWECLF